VQKQIFVLAVDVGKSSKLLWTFVNLIFNIGQKPNAFITSKPYRANCAKDLSRKSLFHWERDLLSNIFSVS